jgi:DNA gyrase subunit B
VRRALRYVKVLQLLDKRGDTRLVDAIVRVGRGDLSSEQAARAWLDGKVRPYLAAHYPELARVEIDFVADAEHGGVRLHVPARGAGIRKATNIDFELLALPELEELRKLSGELDGLLAGPWTLERGDSRTRFGLLEPLARAIDEIGRKGLQIQRYKGLGEMNAEQLWETTMDPEKRTLLKVSVQDAPEAEKIFSTLMGDLVEPRREFIEKNALNVRNLDV